MLDQGSDGDPPGEEVVIEALQALEPPVDIPSEAMADLDALSDVLLDAQDRFSDTDLLYLLTCLLVEDFDVLARTYCEAEHLLMDAHRLAEDCVVRVFTSAITGTRRRPYASWKYRVVRESAERCRWEDGMALRPETQAPESNEMLSNMAITLNRLDREMRRVLWLSWVEQLDLHEIVRMTGYPLERVEWWIDRSLREVREASNMDPEERRETLRDEDLWKWLDESEGDT